MSSFPSGLIAPGLLDNDRDLLRNKAFASQDLARDGSHGSHDLARDGTLGSHDLGSILKLMLGFLIFIQLIFVFIDLLFYDVYE